MRSGQGHRQARVMCSAVCEPHSLDWEARWVSGQAPSQGSIGSIERKSPKARLSMLPWVPQIPRNKGEETTPGGDTCKIWGEQRFDDFWKGGLVDDSLWAGEVRGGGGRKSGYLREEASWLRITSVSSEPSLWQGSTMHREPGLFFLAPEGTGGGGAGKGKLRWHLQWARGLRRQRSAFSA